MTVIILAITGLLLFLAFVVGVWRIMLAVMLVRPSWDQIFQLGERRLINAPGRAPR
jgi:hypothetical protein